VVRYRAEPIPAAQTLAVSVSVDAPAPRQTFVIPGWTPGYYQLRRSDLKISDVRATTEDGRPLKVSRSGTLGWTVDSSNAKRLVLSYRVLADDPGLGFFGVSVAKDQAFINGPAAFMYPEGRASEGTELRLKLPEGWDVATGMDKRDDAYVAGDYDELVDHPLQLGRFVRRTFDVEGVPFEAVFVAEAKPAVNTAMETERLKRLSEPVVRMFGGAPFKRYVYIIHLAVGEFSGGLEHRASSVVALPNAARLDADDLFVHELFHAWNVKQIRPRILGPFDYTKPARTGALWFAEGVTDYYARRLVYQSGLRDEKWLFDQLAAEITMLELGETQRVKSVAAASRETWEDSGFGVGDLSYYNKGFILGLVFDAVLRGSTDGRKSLDDVMRLMYERYRYPKAGYSDDGILLALNEVSGRDLTNLYRQLVDEPKPVPYALLKQIGMRLIFPDRVVERLPFQTSDGVITSLEPSATAAGLRRGDRVESVEVIRDSEPSRARVRVGGKDLTVPLATVKPDTYDVEPNPWATPAERRRLGDWLARPNRVVQKNG